MNDFFKDLLGVRSGRTSSSSSPQLKAERQRNMQMINDNFGNPENYRRQQQNSDTPSPTIGPALKSFFNSLVGNREKTRPGPSK